MKLKTPDIQQWKIWKVTAVFAAVTIFGFIPGLGLPGAVYLLAVSLLPPIGTLTERMQGDAAWGVAIELNFIVPIAAYVLFLLIRKIPASKMTAGKRLLLWLGLSYVAMYASSLHVLQKYDSIIQADPAYGTMMEYLPH